MLKPVVFLLILKLISCNETVDFYEQLIIAETAKSEKYHLPNDASQFRPTRPGTKDFGSFDYIIIGAGSTGCVVANRLSENSTVLLLEAGNLPNIYTAIAGTPHENKYYSDLNWGYRSVPQTTACLGMDDKICPYPRGRGVGGSSLINDMIYARGAPKDFDDWAALGNEGWSFKDVLPYFKRSEDFHKNDPIAPVACGYHGYGGPVYVGYPLPRNPQADAFFAANKRLGYNLTDNNGPNVIGDTPVQRTIKYGRRQDTGTAFILPILGRKNLRLLTGAYATKINVDKNKVATSVRFTYRNQTYIATARNEIVLSAGSFGSAQILMLSGIGPKNHLEKVSIPVIEDLQVGSKLYDHPTFYGLTFSTNVSAPQKDLRQLVKEYLKGVGSLTKAGYAQTLGFYQSTFESAPHFPDIEFEFLSPVNIVNTTRRNSLPWSDEAYDAIYKGFDMRKTFSIFVILLHSYSEGTVRLKSADPFQYPLIDSRFLSDDKNPDIDVIYQGIQLALKLVDTEPFRRLGGKLQARPLPQCKQHKFQSREYWYCAIRILTYNVYHPVGTCRMGADPKRGATVDSRLKVHGTRKLRVADASVFPFTLSGHPNAPCMMIGEKLSDILKQEHKV